ncbi:MAG: PHP domain-containing protein [Syntrophomonadaceae bacterium]
MQFYGDYHTHTVNSDGRQTVAEIVDAACRRGLKEVAITDHGPLAAVIGVKSPEVYLSLRRTIDEINAQNNSIRVLLGAEANIRDRRGNLDIPEEVIEQLDILIAGMHPYTLPTSVGEGIALFAQNSLRHLGPKQKEKAIMANTEATVAVLDKNPEIDILSHPGLFFTVDVEEVARACLRNDVLFEINCGHGQPPISDIMKAEQIGVQFIINSDAHFPDSVGYLEYGARAVRKLGIKEERIVNLTGNRGYSPWRKKLQHYMYS